MHYKVFSFWLVVTQTSQPYVSSKDCSACYFLVILSLALDSCCISISWGLEGQRTLCAFLEFSIYVAVLFPYRSPLSGFCPVNSSHFWTLYSVSAIQRDHWVWLEFTLLDLQFGKFFPGSKLRQLYTLPHLILFSQGSPSYTTYCPISADCSVIIFVCFFSCLRWG